MKFDLHCHSTASDGLLSPYQLLQLAEERDIELFAITDHDSISGFNQIRHLAPSEGLSLISGVEFSSLWQNIGVHIIGLNFDPEQGVIEQAINSQRLVRQQRAEIISAKLERKGMVNTYQGALAYCDNKPWQLGRPHFASFLVAQGYVDNHQQAFTRWLGAGKCGDVKNGWPALQQVVAWIVDAGGVAVLAHPAKYNLTNGKLGRLLSDFKAVAGQALEVVSAGQNAQITAYLAGLCERYGFYASGGSDFHDPSTAWAQLGQLPALPSKCQPVWALW